MIRDENKPIERLAGRGDAARTQCRHTIAFVWFNAKIDPHLYYYKIIFNKRIESEKNNIICDLL